MYTTVNQISLLHILSDEKLTFEGDSGEDNHVLFQSCPKFGNHIKIYKGHYKFPTYGNQQLLTPNRDLIDFKDDNDKDNSKIVYHNSDDYITIGAEKDERKRTYTDWYKDNYNGVKLWINQQENKGLKMSLIIMTGCVIAMFWYLQIQVSHYICFLFIYGTKFYNIAYKKKLILNYKKNSYIEKKLHFLSQFILLSNMFR